MANYVLDVTRIPEGASTNPDGDVGTVSAHRFCVQSATDNQNIDTAPDAVGALVLGVTMDELDASKLAEGGSISVRLMGIAPVRVGVGGVTRGTRVMTAVDGTAITAATAASFVSGLALQSGIEDAIVDVLLIPGGTKFVA